MKVNGADHLIKLLLKYNNQNNRVPASGEKVNIENLSMQVEEVLTQSDEVILRGDSLLKPEIQFSRQLHETAEVYLQRISSEMIKYKESKNSIQEEQRQLLPKNDESVDIALRAGLLKKLVDQNKLSENSASDVTETRWLLIFSVFFIAFLIVYLIFRK